MSDMIRITRRVLGAAAACLAWLLMAGPQPARAQASPAAGPPPISAFFSPDEMSQPVLSPSGKYLALRVATEVGRRQLAIVTLGTPHAMKLIAGYGNADIGAVHWVSDDRLVYTINDLQAPYGEGIYPGLFAIDRSGENQRELVRRSRYRFQTGTHIVSRELSPYHQLLRTLRDGSNEVMLLRYDYDTRGEYLGSVLVRVNTSDGRSRAVDTGLTHHARRWQVDDQGVPHAASSVQGGRIRLHWRRAADQPWQVVHETDLYGGQGLEPFAIGADRQLYALARRNDAEHTAALYRFDAQTAKLETEPLVGLTGFDFSGRLIFDRPRGKLLGVRFVSDAASTHWLDPGLKAVQADIDKQMPNTVNLLDVAECNCARWLPVTAFSDRQPAVYALYDRETGKLEIFGQSRKAIQPSQMANRDFQRIKVRDGLTIPVHITQPAGKGPWPTVVLVHGGPYVRGGSWGWDDESQFLASRGYLVVEPEFRGSRGYGGRLFRAGWKQWGLKMQDDIADATRWAIGQGLADAKRVCIAGASYGGYATLMGLINDPQLYRCGVSWLAVTDIGLLSSINWSDLSEVYRNYGLPVLVGDPEKDAAQLAATSPLKQAARIKAPLLLAYGGEDRRVPLDHGTALRAALKDHNDQVEWVLYANEGHGFYQPENRYDFYGRMERFLDKHLKQAP